MAQIAKMEVQTEVKCSADKFYDIFRRKASLIPKICPEKIKDIQLLQGDWDSMGSVKLWTYVLDKNELKVKEKMEAVDEENKMITYNILEGEILKYHKSFKSTIQVTAKDKGSIVKWTLKYEKLKEDVPDPDFFLDFTIKITKDIDDHLLKA